jgi:phosphate transport system substrate-binding protein
MSLITKKIAILSLISLFGYLPTSHALTPPHKIQGAGSSAAAPIYQSWAQAYQKATGSLLDYEPIGSSAGLKKIREQATHFGASDVAPSAADLDRDGLLVFPVAITGIAPVLNLPQFKGTTVRLTGEVLARIFTGDITHWSHADIARLNPDATFPKLPIKVVVRSDGSGTTFNFADYLAKVSPQWKAQYGVKTRFEWPQTSAYLPAKGSSGVVKAVKETPGAIGYVDYGYVKATNLLVAHMQNQEGQFVSPSIQTFRNALKNSDWASHSAFTTTLTDQTGKDTWPITMGTFILIPKVSKQPEKTVQAMRFFVWAFMNGDALVQANNFVRLTDEMQAAAFRVISSIKDPAGEPLGPRVIKGF